MLSNQSVKMWSTWFYIGYLPVAPGSMGSLAATLLAIALVGHPFLHILCFIGVTLIGFKTAGRMEDVLGQKDPGCVVIDEVAGVLISFFLLPLSWPIIVCTYFLFRAFDMFKITPADRLENMGGATGIMMDDILAGLYTNIVMHIAIRWAGIV